MTMGILTELTEDEQKKNELAIEALDAIEALLQSYDPDSKLGDDIHDDLLWRAENLLIDLSYEVEELVETVTDHPGVEYVKAHTPEQPDGTFPPFAVGDAVIEVSDFDSDWDGDDGAYVTVTEEEDLEG